MKKTEKTIRKRKTLRISHCDDEKLWWSFQSSFSDYEFMQSKSKRSGDRKKQWINNNFGMELQSNEQIQKGQEIHTKNKWVRKRAWFIPSLRWLERPWCFDRFSPSFPLALTWVNFVEMYTKEDHRRKTHDNKQRQKDIAPMTGLFQLFHVS